MPVPNNPGTPAAGQPQSEAGNPATPPKKYAGKYNSLEEAVELGYGGLEKGFNDLNEKFSNMTRLLEAAVAAPQEPVPTVGGSNYNPQGYDPYSRNTPQPNNFTVDFLTNPAAHLEAREQAMMQKVANVVSNTVTNAMAVADFKLRNPDLVKHEPLVRTFMAQTDQRRPVAERLEDAAKAARAYIAQNFQAPSNPPPGGDNYVEQPRGAITGYAPGSPPPPPSSTTAEEQALVDYLNDRNATKAQNMGVGYDPNAK
jgi:hypothetical protein